MFIHEKLLNIYQLDLFVYLCKLRSVPNLCERESIYIININNKYIQGVNCA